MIRNHVPRYFKTLTFRLKEIFVTEPMRITRLSVSITFIVAKHSALHHLNFVSYSCLTLSLSSPCVYVCMCVRVCACACICVRAVISLIGFWRHCSNSLLLWRGSPYLLLLSLCLWQPAAAHWRSYMTVKRAINAGEREAEVYGCLSLP